MKPMERKAIAIIPASTPGPRIETKRRAQMSELIEREATMIKSARGRKKRVLGVVLRAAKNATGTAITVPSAVPKVAILRVSHNAHQRSLMDNQSGGTIRLPISSARFGASVTNSQIVSSVMIWKAQLIKAKSKTHAKKVSSPCFDVRFDQA